MQNIWISTNCRDLTSNFLIGLSNYYFALCPRHSFSFFYLQSGFKLIQHQHGTLKFEYYRKENCRWSLENCSKTAIIFLGIERTNTFFLEKIKNKRKLKRKVVHMGESSILNIGGERRGGREREKTNVYSSTLTNIISAFDVI